MRTNAVMKWTAVALLAVGGASAMAQGAAGTLSGPPGPMRARDPEHPAITRDGKTVAFSVRSLGMDRKPAGVDLWLVNSDGSGLHQITAGEFDTRPSFSPDGRQIVFLRKMDRAADGSYKTDVFVLNLNNNSLRRLTTTPKTEYAPIFTPDGNSVLFIRETHWVLEDGELIQFDLATGQEKILIDGKYKVQQVAPSPLEPGRYIAAAIRLGPNNEPSKEKGAVFQDKALISFKADGNDMRTVYAPKLGHSLPKFLVSDKKIYAQVSWFLASNLLEIQGSEAKTVAIEDIKFAEDLSADGNLFVGAGFVDERFNKGVWIYNLATSEYKVIQKAPKSDVTPEAPTTPEGGTTPVVATKPEPVAAPAPQKPAYVPDPRWAKARELVGDGDTHSNAGRYDEAIKQYSAALAIDVDSETAYFGRGIAYEKQGKVAEAIRDYDKAIELNGEYFEALSNRGALLAREGKEDAALQDYNAAIKIYPDFWAAHYNRGLLLLKRNDREGALDDFNASIANRPNFPNHYLKRGDLLVALNRRDEALTAFNRYIELQPNDWHGYASRGKWYGQTTQAEMVKKGIADFDRAIRLQPGDYSLVMQRAALHARNGDHQKAVVDYTTAIKSKYMLPTAYKQRAAAYRKLGKVNLAVADEKMAKTAQP